MEAKKLAALIFGIHDVFVVRILPGIKSITEANIFPILVLNSANALRWTFPRAVVLKSAVNIVGLVHVVRDMVEL